MPSRRYAFEDPGPGIDPPIISEQPDDVAEVRVLEDFCLFVRFFDGTQGIVDMRQRVVSQKAGVFAALADPTEFARVGLAFGAVAWANGLDLAPDAMHDEIQRNGVWVLL